MNQKLGRTLCICSRCNKEKIHFGLGMCSACLRRTKRETRPSFYLGTCYSEMSRRVKTYDPERPNYFGKEICTKEDFINLFLYDSEFLRLYKKWQNSDYKRKHAPSIDRIDNEKGYIISNLRFTTHFENTGKDARIAIKLVKGSEVIIFKSCRDAAKFLGTQTSHFCRIRKEHGYYKGYNIYEII